MSLFQSAVSYRDVSVSAVAFDACSTAVSSPTYHRPAADCQNLHYQTSRASSSSCGYLPGTLPSLNHQLHSCNQPKTLHFKNCKNANVFVHDVYKEHWQ